MKIKSISFLILFLMNCGEIRPEKEKLLRKVAHQSNGWMKPDNPGFHGHAVQEKVWNTTACEECHSEPSKSCPVCHYEKSMKETDVSHQIPSLCTTCHKDSISACNTCHGNGNNPAPPDALDGSVSKSYIGVGAHQIHVAENEFTDAFKCHDCHEQPCAGHYDTAPPAEVCFSAIAKSGIWDRTSMRCSNILCHGDSLGGTKLSNLAWNTVNTAAIKCGDCHSLPPEKTLSGDFHPALKECVQCHSDVVDSKQRIISKEKHIRGL